MITLADLLNRFGKKRKFKLSRTSFNEVGVPETETKTLDVICVISEVQNENQRYGYQGMMSYHEAKLYLYKKDFVKFEEYDSIIMEYKKGFYNLMGIKEFDENSDIIEYTIKRELV